MERDYLVKIERNENYGQKIYQQIKELIITGKLKAGSPINEREYATNLGVSRTPLREALTLLEKEGWIQQEGKTRTISALLWKQILDLIDIRESLDMNGFRLAFPKCGPDDFFILHQILHKMEDAGAKNGRNFYTVMGLDTSFHQYINHKSGNDLLIRISDDIGERVTRSSVLSMKYSWQSVGEFVQEHLKVLQAMEQGNLEQACIVLADHYKNWENRMWLLPQLIGFDPDDLSARIPEEFIRVE